VSDQTSPEPVSSAPRYMALAETLRSGIASGTPAVGELLPTEHSLTEQYGVSRHTVREALRLLAEAGLIARRRGAGTVVVASEARASFTQRLGGVDDLMQYERNTRLKPLRQGHGPLDPTVARALGVAPGGEYFHVHGLRSQPDRAPVALTDMYVRADLAPSVEVMVELNGGIVEWMATERSAPTARIEQIISGGMLTDGEAESLDCDPGTAALRTRRRYYDQGGRIIALSDTVHPADRFSYEMTMLRESD